MASLKRFSYYKYWKKEKALTKKIIISVQIINFKNVTKSDKNSNNRDELHSLKRNFTMNWNFSNYHSLNFWEKKNVFQKTLRCHYTQFPFWNCKTVKYEKNSETHCTFILIFFPHCLKSQRGKKSWIGSFAFQTNDFFNRFNLGYRLLTLVSVQTNKWISNE